MKRGFLESSSSDGVRGEVEWLGVLEKVWQRHSAVFPET